MTDLPLSPSGLTTLLHLKNTAVYPGAARFFTSPLTRCRQTLEVLYPGCHQETVDGLAECDFGDWEGRNVSELKMDAGFQRWLSGEQTKIPGGEDAKTFQNRVMTAFEDLVQQLMRSGDTEAVVCTHGGVIMMIMAAYALPKSDMHNLGNG